MVASPGKVVNILFSKQGIRCCNEDEEEFVEHRYTQLKKVSGETFSNVSDAWSFISDIQQYLSCVYLCSTNSSSSSLQHSNEPPLQN